MGGGGFMMDPESPLDAHLLSLSPERRPRVCFVPTPAGDRDPVIAAFFETFAIIDAVTRGGPAGATNILVYKVYQDGFLNLDLGSSAAQSVILMLSALALTLLQFRYVERKVNYDV